MLTGVVIGGSENQWSIYFKGNHLTPVQMVQEVKIKPFLLSCWWRCCNKSYTVLLKRLVGYLKRILCRVLRIDPKSSESQQSQISSPGLNSLSRSCHYSCQSVATLSQAAAISIEMNPISQVLLFFIMLITDVKTWKGLSWTCLWFQVKHRKSQLTCYCHGLYSRKSYNAWWEMILLVLIKPAYQCGIVIRLWKVLA